MLWVTPEEAEAEYVCELLTQERVVPCLRFAPARGRVGARWIVTAELDNPGKERRVRQRLEGILPRDWS